MYWQVVTYEPSRSLTNPYNSLNSAEFAWFLLMEVTSIACQQMWCEELFLTDWGAGYFVRSFELELVFEAKLEAAEL
ncbi:hypothetical protein NUACC21_19930 [Scytonema sp. NUACC21]